MKVYVIIEDCPDPFYEEAFQGNVFSTEEKAKSFIESNPSAYRRTYIEVEVDAIH